MIEKSKDLCVGILVVSFFIAIFYSIGTMLDHYDPKLYITHDPFIRFVAGLVFSGMSLVSIIVIGTIGDQIRSWWSKNYGWEFKTRIAEKIAERIHRSIKDQK